MKQKPKVYNDGVCQIVLSKGSKVSDFAARENDRVKEDFDIIYTLPFAEMSRREQDLEFCEAMGRSLTLKIKTRLVPNVKSQHNVIVLNAKKSVLYSIINADPDRKNNELYLYIEEVRELA